MDLRLLLAATLFGGLAVVFGAFGSHALRGRLTPEQLAIFEIGVRYQMYHALALLGVAVLVVRMPGTSLPLAAGWLFIIGVVIFSGSLYLLALTGTRAMGAITPIGGVLLIVGWALLSLAALRGLTTTQAIP
jgi:uncharacterized membrane protein YgdD (TMEM256/DUF423 family)